MKILSMAVGMLFAMGVSASWVHPATSLMFSELPTLPDSEGFAGSFAGVSGGSLIVAGGANFPDKKPWEDGRKIWHDSVFVLEKPDAAWKAVGKLPRPLAYGVSVTIQEGIVCVGGSDAEKHYAEVFILSHSKGRLKTKRLPDLPIPMANGVGALFGKNILVFGGSEQPGENAALNRLFSLDPGAANPAWHELEPCPGKPRIFPVAAVVNGAFHIAGGAALEPINGQVTRAYLRDTWCYQRDRGWKRLGDIPEPRAAAASPAPLADSRFYLIGGDDGSRVGFHPIDKHPGFSRSILCYDSSIDAWSGAGESPVARATWPAVFWRGCFVLPSGEVRPGVRSPRVWAFQPVATTTNY